MKTKPKGVWIVTTVISLFAIVAGTFYASRTKEQAENSNAAADVSLVFNTPNLNSNINTVLTPKLTINPTTNQVTAVEVYMTFDSSKVMINSITNATKFAKVLKAPIIDNNAGTVSFILGINGGIGITPVPVTTVSDVVTISLTTKGVIGDAVINVATNSKVAAKGVDTSVIGTFGQMVVHIATPSTATPSPSPSPTPSRSPSPTPSPTPVPTPTRTPSPSPTVVVTATPSVSPTASSTTYPAWDVDRNGIINIVDIGLISDNYGSSSPTTARADVNQDGAINVVDIGIVVDHYQ